MGRADAAEHHQGRHRAACRLDADIRVQAVAVGYNRSQLGFCGSVRLGAVLNNHVGVADNEQGAPVWICSDLRESWAAIWSQHNLG
jgi:hypothetical protein